MDCLFCKIINKEIKSNIIVENEKAIVFEDINPKAPVHLLVAPKKHIPSINELEEKDKELIGDLVILAKESAKLVGIKDSGYKLVFHVGEGGGQEIFHVHLHLLGGWK